VTEENVAAAPEKSKKIQEAKEEKKAGKRKRTQASILN
jgi:hypothetical protein